MACLRSAESVREFVSAVTSPEAAAGIYALIRNSVDIDCYTDQCRSQCACFAFARRACWLCQQDSCNKITKNIETHLRTHFNPNKKLLVFTQFPALILAKELDISLDTPLIRFLFETLLTSQGLMKASFKAV